MRINIRRMVLWLALVSLLLVAGAGQVALADSSVHRIIWTSGSNSTINADKNQMVSSPASNYTTEHIMDLNFSFTGNADRYQAEIRFPAYLFYDRDGNPITTIPGPDNKPISTVEVPLPQYDPANPAVSEPPEAATKFNWRIENNEVILSNYLPIKDNFFVTLQIKYRVLPYLVKNGYTNTINAAMTVNTLSGQTETYTSNDLAITYKTKADLYSFTKSAGTADSFRVWQTTWGSPPEGIDPSEYFYVRWRLYANASTNDTQPFSVSFLESNPPGDEYGTMFAYSTSTSGGFKSVTSEGYAAANDPTKVIPRPLTGTSSENTNWTSYVYYMYPKTLLDENLTATVKNQAEFELEGIDDAYEKKQAAAQLTFVDKPPDRPSAPGDSVTSLIKRNTGTSYGAINRLENNQLSGDPVRLIGNSALLGNFNFYGTVTGWEMSREGDSYGVRPWTAEMTDDQLALYNYTNNSYVPLEEGDYQYTGLYFGGFTVSDPLVTDTVYSTMGRAIADYKPLTLQVKRGGQWSDYGIIQKLATGPYSFTPLGGAPALPNGYALTIPLPAGTTGMRYLYTDNAVQVSFSTSYLQTELFPTERVLGLIKDRDSGTVRNTVSMRGIDDQGIVQAPERTYPATHGITRIKSYSYYSKGYGAVVNDVLTSRYYFPMTLTAYSTVTHPERVLADVLEGDYVIEQKVSTFYDLLPPGSYADLSSIRVTGYGGTLNSTTFPHRVEVHDNWKGSGRTMLIVHAQAPQGINNYYHVVSGTFSTLYSGMTMRFNMYNTWLNVVDNGPYLYNYTAYESQDGALPSGYPDNAGASTIPSNLKSAFTDLNRDGNPQGTINSFMYAGATPYYMPLKAAELGFHKAVASPEDPAFGEHTEVQAGGEYTYRLRLENALVSTKDLVFYDILENAFGTNDHWQGGLTGFDVSHARRLGINVKIYYSLEDPTDAGLYNDATHLDNNPTFWKSWDTNPPADPSQVRALAFDLRRHINGREFVAAPGQSVLVNIQMQAPVDAADHILNGDLAYNRAFCANRKSGLTGAEWDDVVAIEACNIVTVALRDMGLTLDKASIPASGTPDAPMLVYGGDTLEYRISVTNANLAQSLQNILVEDEIPAGLAINLAGIQVMLDDNPNTRHAIGLSTRVDLRSAQGQKLIFRVISLAGEEKITLIIPTTVTPMAEGKPIDFVNTARVTSVFDQAYSLDSPTTYHRQEYTQLLLSGGKTLAGRDMQAGEFAFLLSDGSGTLIQRLENTAAAAGVRAPFTLNTLYFDREGIYTFTLREEPGTLDSVVYDPAVYTITATVTRDSGGALSVQAAILPGSVAVDALDFENVYAVTDFTAKKEWSIPEGSVMTEGHVHPVVQFQLYRDGQAYGDPVDMAPPDNTAALTELPHTWGELPKYRADGAVNEQGQRIESVYTVKEVLVPDSYVMRIPVPTGDSVPVIQNIYWPLARTVHKFWDGPAPEPGTNKVLIEIYQEIRLANLSLNDPYTAREKYPVEILMDGEPEAFPDSIPGNQFEVHGEFSPWTYTIVLPVTGTYIDPETNEELSVNYYYTVKEVSHTVGDQPTTDYKVGTTAVHPGKGADVTNVYQFTSFTANKVWVDGPEIKPDIQLQLLQDGADYPEQAIGLVTLKDGTTTYTWEKLPRFSNWDERAEYVYSFKEVAEPDFPYEQQMSEDGLTLTNRYVPPLFDLVAKKHWVDGAAAHRHPATMLLSRQLNGGPVEEVAEAYTVTPDTQGHAEYTYTWANLPTTDINGNPYTYTVNEASAIGGLVVVGGYVYEVGEPVTDAGVIHITNTFQQPFDAIHAAKFWVGGEAGDQKAVTLALYRQFEDNGQPELVEGVAAPLISGEAPAFIYTWEDLPLTDINARPYQYTVVETGAQDGIVTVDGRQYQVIMDGRAVVNEFIPPLADVVATKRWVGGVAEEDHTPPRMLLYRSLPEEEAPVPGEAEPILDEGGGIVPAEDAGPAPEEDRGPVLVEAGYTVTGSAPEFTYTWHQLPQTDESARPYTYMVLEDGVDDDSHLLVNGRHYAVSQKGMAITNTYLSPETNVVAVKAWVNGPEADHQQAQLILTRRVADGPVETLEQTPLVSGTAPEFTYTWDGLPARDMQAREYVYAVSEAGEEEGRVLINGNTYAVETLVDELGCTLITNTYMPPERAVLNLAARKAMAGDPVDIKAGQFAFTLTGGGLELAATNDASGLVTFPQFAVEKAGEYRFTLKETKGSQAGMAYDGAIYTALVQVSLDPGPNTLAYTLTWQKDGTAYAQAQPVFTNTYTKPAPPDPDPDPDPGYDPINVPISGQKRAVNFALGAGQFQFVIKDHAGNTMETVSHDASGLISFSPLRIRRPGIYLYHITEVAGQGNILYDATRYTVRVEASAQGTKLSAAVSILKDGTPTAGGISFVNRAILPATGDSYLWLPLALLASSLVLFITRRRMLKRG